MPQRRLVFVLCLAVSLLLPSLPSHAEQTSSCEEAVQLMQTEWQASHLLAALVINDAALAQYSDPPDLCANTLYNWRALIQLALQEPADAEQTYRSALERWQQLYAAQPSASIQLATAATANNLGLLLARSGRFQEALAFFTASLRTLPPERLGNRAPTPMPGMPSRRGTDDEAMLARQQVILLNNIGLVYLNLNDYVKADRAFEQARLSTADAGQQAETLNHKALVARSLGRYAEAHQLLNAAETILPAQHPVGAIIWNNRGIIYAAEGRYSQAIMAYQKALTYQAVPLALEPAEVVFQFSAGLGRGRRVMDNSGPRYETVSIVNSADDVAARATTNHNIGNAYRLQGDLVRATLYFREALRLAEQAGNINGMIASYYALSLTHQAAGEWQQAMLWDEQALTQLESLTSYLTIPELQSSFNAKQAPIYADLIRLLVADGKDQAAFDLSERARARAFLNQLGNHAIDLAQGISPRFVAQQQALQQQIVGLQTALNAEKTNPSPNQAVLDDLSRQLETARDNYTALLTELKLSNPEYAALLTIDTLTLDQVRTDGLDAQTTLISYFVLAEEVLAWVIDRDGFTLVHLPIVNAQLTSEVEFLRNLISKDQDFDFDPAASLYAELVAPLQPYIHHSNLVIIPHGVLHYLPFAALWDTNSQHYLIQDYAITYAPSASALPFILNKHKPDQGRLLALGNADGSLPQAETEVYSVTKLYNTRPLVRAQATESQIYKQATQINMLHLATHGVYDPYNALYSRIELAADNANDGNLEVHEIFGLALQQTNLVVLSACDTSQGQLSSGDEIMGLTRAFLYAGTPAVVTTLWPIDDGASGALMEAFYRHLQTGMTNAEALRAAQMEILAQEKWHSPYYWAAFNLTGNYRGR